MKKSDIIVHWSCLKKELHDDKDYNATNRDHGVSEICVEVPFACKWLDGIYPIE